MDSIVGRARPRAGSIRVGGRLVDEHRRWCRSQIGYADQELALFPTHCAMAIVAHPPVLLLDEPTVGVDLDTRRSLLNYVRALAGEGAAICYSTHYLHEVEHLDADVVLLRDGRMLVDRGVGDLIARHSSPVIEIQVADRELIRVPSDDPSRNVPQLLDQFRREGRKLTSLAIRSPTLDDVFDRFVESKVGVDGR